MKLIWKLLRQHISIVQFAGFALANLFGMLIILMSYQFYRDVLPVFTQGDSFMSADFIVVSKHISEASSLTGKGNTFSEEEIEDMEAQRFSVRTGKFSSTAYKVDARMGVQGTPVLNSELFFESVPDEFIDLPLHQWTWNPGDQEVPVILPRTYINMYNFGFAHTHSLPKISDGLMGMIDFHIFIRGNGRQDEYRGKVIGFSNRLNSILVPQRFMDWSNQTYAPDEQQEPTRLIVQVANSADETVLNYMDKQDYEVENDKLNAEKTSYFLKLVVMLVMAIGVVICALSFYILMLSIYLLVQKNTSKLENLLLIGYSPVKVGMPYQMLTAGINLLVLLIAIVAVFFIRDYYMEVLELLFPNMSEGNMLPAFTLGCCLFLLVTLCNHLAIRNKVVRIWKRKDVAMLLLALFVASQSLSAQQAQDAKISVGQEVRSAQQPMKSVQQPTMSQLFSEMPDSLFPYLSRVGRLDMIDFSAYGMKAEVTNRFDGKTEMLRLTDDYLHIRLSAVADVEMKVLPDSSSAPGDSLRYLICMVTTYGSGKCKDSAIRFYDTSWQSVERALRFRAPAGCMYAASLSPEEATLELQAMPIQLEPNRTYMNDYNHEIKAYEDSVNLQKKLKWNGFTFKEY